MITREIDHYPSRHASIGNGTGLVPLDARIALRDAFDDQASLIASGRYEVFSGKRENDFLNTFVADPLFSDICTNAQVEAKVQLDDREFKRRVRGAIFAAMSKLYVSSIDQRGVPVFGSIVSDIVALGNPDARVLQHGFGEAGIEGKTVFDGYMLKACDQEPQVSSFIESTLSVNWGGDQRKLRQIASAPGVARELGNMAQEFPGIILVSPTPDDKSFSKVDQGRGQSVRCMRVPVKQNTIMYELMPFVYHDVKDASGRSLEDLRAEWRQSPVGRQVGAGEPSAAIFRP